MEEGLHHPARIPWRQVRKHVITIVGGRDVSYGQQRDKEPERNFWKWFQFPDTPHANACRAHVLAVLVGGILGAIGRRS